MGRSMSAGTTAIRNKWSPGGEKNQDNTVTLTEDRDAVVSERRFEALWDRPKNHIIH